MESTPGQEDRMESTPGQDRTGNLQGVRLMS